MRFIDNKYKNCKIKTIIWKIKYIHKKNKMRMTNIIKSYRKYLNINICKNYNIKMNFNHIIKGKYLTTKN